MSTPLTLSAFVATAKVLGSIRAVSFKKNTLKIHDVTTDEAHRLIALLNPDASTTFHNVSLDPKALADALAKQGIPTPSAPPAEPATDAKPAKPAKVKKSPEPAETKTVPLLEATLDPPAPVEGAPTQTASTEVPVDEKGNPDPWGLAGKDKPAAAPASSGDVDLSRFDAEKLGAMGKLKEILPYLREEKGVAGYKAMLATCLALKAAGVSPILVRIENLEERLLRGFETLGWSTED